jgi:hypothetical protein
MVQSDDGKTRYLGVNPEAEAEELFDMTYSTLDLEGPRMLFDIKNLSLKILDTTQEKVDLVNS